MKQSLNILFVSPYVPSLVRIRPYAFIRELAKRGHQVTLACLVQPSWENAYLPEVAPYCKAVYPVYLGRFEPYLYTLASLPTRVPLSVAYCRSAQLEQLVHDLNSQNHYDLIHTEFVRAVPATIHLLPNGSARVFDAVDSLTLTHERSLSASYIPFKQRLISMLEWLKMRRYEPRILDHFDHVFVSSPEDRVALQRQCNNHITVIPNGVDMDYFAFQQGQRDSETIIFLGKMSYYVNVASTLWFYHEVLPLIRHQRPNIRFKIVGRDPNPKIKSLATDPSVEVTGTVRDVRPHLARATLSVCPMVSGAGIQNKMLEAMAIGSPTVATSLACHALKIVPGREVLISDTAVSFAASILNLLNEPALRHTLAENGRHYVEQHHNWQKIGDNLEKAYRSVLNGSRGEIYV